MKVSELKQKSPADLQAELHGLLREQFNLRVQKTVGEKPRAHLFKNLRRNIAQIKTILTDKAK